MILIIHEEDNRPLNRLILGELYGDIIRFDFLCVVEEIRKFKDIEETIRAKAMAGWAAKYRKNPDVQNS